MSSSEHEIPTMDVNHEGIEEEFYLPDGSKVPDKFDDVSQRSNVTCRRQRNLTEKGAEYYINLQTKRRKMLIEELIRKKCFIEESMRTFKNVPDVINTLRDVDSITAELYEVNERLFGLLGDENFKSLYEQNQQIDQDTVMVKTMATRWLKDAEKDDARSHSSRSSSSTASSRSSRSGRTTSSKRYMSSLVEKVAVEEAKLAELRLEMSLTEEKSRLDQEARNLKLKEEQQKSEARVAVYRKYANQQDAEVKIDETRQNAATVPDDVIRSRTQQYINDAFNSSPAAMSSSVPVYTAAFSVSIPENVSTTSITSTTSSTQQCNTDVYMYSQAASDPVSLSKYIISSKPYELNDSTYSNHQHVQQPNHIASKKNQIESSKNQHSMLESSSSPKVPTDKSYDVLCKLLREQGAPVADLDVFTGNPLDYKYFMKSFEEVVEQRIVDSRGRLTRLMKCTGGEAKELIKGCIHKEDGYFYAKQLLEKRYGDHHRILGEYRKQLREWKPLRAGDGESYRKFYSFLLQCSSLVDGRVWSALDSPDNLRMILSKLPGAARDRWNRKVLQIRTSLREPELNDLIQFVENETTLMTDPLYSRDALQEFNNTTSTPAKIHGKIKTFSNHLPIICPCCKDAHDLDDCSTFSKKDIKGKMTFIMRARLCFGCLSKTHIIKDCRKRRTCMRCNEKHPTCLHGMKPKPKDEKNKNLHHTDSQYAKKRDIKGDVKEKQNDEKLYAAASWSQQRVISICVVPVTIRHKNSKIEVKTHALLDSCSQGTFASDELIKDLKVNGIPTEITIKTLNGEQTDKSRMIQDLMIKSSYDESDSWTKLPKTYTRQEISSSEEEVATFEKLKRWKYLNRLKNKLCDVDDVKIGILVGANCPAALEPEEVIRSQDNGPYAFRTKLGWCVVGPIDQLSERNHVTCKRISLQTRSLIVNEIEFKDVGIQNMLKQLYNIDKVESRNHIKIANEYDLDEISQNDLKFMKILQQNTKMTNGHFEVPLPFKCEVQLPNNRWIAMKRAETLKKKFIKDKFFQKD